MLPDHHTEGSPFTATFTQPRRKCSGSRPCVPARRPGFPRSSKAGMRWSCWPPELENRRSTS
jgi:hypothetical protein